MPSNTASDDKYLDGIRKKSAFQRLLTGVYCIHNTYSNKRYVGSASIRFSVRWWSHRSSLRKGTHYNDYLQKAWRKWGENAFTFSVLERCLPENCLEVEAFWIQYYKVTDRRFGYNIYFDPRSPRGIKRPPHVGKAVAEANRSRVWTEETREKRRQALLGNTHAAGLIGSKNANSKLTEETVREIRRLWATGKYRITDLYKKFKVGYTAISDVVHNRKWTHVK